MPRGAARDRPRDPGQRPNRRDLALRLPRGERSAGEPPDPGEVDWSQTGLVSLFVRDRVGEPRAFAGGTERSELLLADPRAEGGMRKRLREQIRRNERRGWSVGAEPGPQADAGDLRAFEVRLRGDDGEDGRRPALPVRAGLLRNAARGRAAWLLLAGREGEAASAGAIAVSSDGFLHYFLGGTADAALADSPMKNLFAAMTSLAGELGLRLNLGGGVIPGDWLEAFKRGFANATAPFRTHEMVCDPDAYRELAGDVAAPAGFFPPTGPLLSAA